MLKRILLIIAISIASSFVGFVLHVYFTEFFFSFIEKELENISVTPSWDVKYLAAVSSVETGIGITILYYLIKDKLPFKNTFLRGGILSLILLAVMGRLIRQPLMDYAIGNTLYVSVMQNITSWIVWFAICFITIFLYDKYLFEIKK